MLQNLSAELQLLVIAELHPVEIVRLQQTCRHLRDLVEAFSRTIWKHCLRRQSFESDVFWPTFKDLKEGSEFKKAATSATQFSKAHADAARRSEPIAAYRRFMRLPMDGDKFRDIYLVQGGRFVMVFGEKRVTMWEVVPPAEEGSEKLELNQILSKEVDHLQQVLATTIVDNQKIRALIVLEPKGSPLSIYQVLEVSFSETEVECLQFVDNAVVFFDEDEKITVFWDTARDKYASWKHEGSLPVLGIFVDSSYTHIFYVVPEGVVADEIPPLRPVVDGRPAVTAASSAVSTKSHKWLHEDAYYLDATNSTPNFVGPEVMTKTTRVPDPSSLYFQVRDIVPSKDFVRLRAFKFAFDPKDPLQTVPQLVDTTRFEYPEESDLQPVFRRPCEGSLATLWLDLADVVTQHFITIAPPIETPSGSDLLPQKTLPLVQFNPSMEFQSGPAWEWEPFYEFDPVSGKILILHGFLSGEPSVELYDFL